VLEEEEYSIRDSNNNDLDSIPIVHHVRGSSWHNEGGDILWRVWLRMGSAGVPPAITITLLVIAFIVVTMILPLLVAMSIIAWMFDWTSAGLLVGWWLQMLTCGAAAQLLSRCGCSGPLSNATGPRRNTDPDALPRSN